MGDNLLLNGGFVMSNVLPHELPQLLTSLVLLLLIHLWHFLLLLANWVDGLLLYLGQICVRVLTTLHHIFLVWQRGVCSFLEALPKLGLFEVMVFKHWFSRVITILLWLIHLETWTLHQPLGGIGRFIPSLKIHITSHFFKVTDHVTCWLISSWRSQARVGPLEICLLV